MGPGEDYLQGPLMKNVKMNMCTHTYARLEHAAHHKFTLQLAILQRKFMKCFKKPLQLKLSGITVRLHVSSNSNSLLV